MCFIVELLIIFLVVIWGVAIVEMAKIVLLILSILVPFLGICIMFKHRRDDVLDGLNDLVRKMKTSLNRFRLNQTCAGDNLVFNCRELIDELDRRIKLNKVNKKYKERYGEIAKIARKLYDKKCHMSVPKDKEILNEYYNKLCEKISEYEIEY